MAISKEKKQAVLDKLGDITRDSQSIVFVRFHALSGADAVSLRVHLREAGVGYVVAKKTLIKRAFDGVFTGELPPLEGEIAVAYGSDVIAPARGIHTFAAEHQDNLSIVGGVLDGVYKDQAAMRELATIPPLPILRGMFVNVINAPVAGLAVALGQIAAKKAS